MSEQSDELIEAVTEEVWRQAAATSPNTVARFVVDRLRAGGISDLVIRKCLCGDGFTVTQVHDETTVRLNGHVDANAVGDVVSGIINTVAIIATGGDC